MDQQNMKNLLKQTFDTVATGYDDRALRFFPESAENLAEILHLRGDERALDVACGTGHASFALAARLPKGHVTAVDFSSGMLERARKKETEQQFGNLEFLERDMRELGFENEFDLAVCAFGIFFVEDMDKQLAHIASAVKPGGRIAITCFLESYFSPLKELFFERIASYGVPTPPQTWKRVAHEDGCRDLFAKAGLTNIHVEVRNVGYNLLDADDWWSIVWNAGLRRLVTQLSPRDQQRFKREHLREVNARKNIDGIWLDVGVLYTVGTKV